MIADDILSDLTLTEFKQLVVEFLRIAEKSTSEKQIEGCIQCIAIAYYNMTTISTADLMAAVKLFEYATKVIEKRIVDVRLGNAFKDTPK